jgi:hypothetical protein
MHVSQGVIAVVVWVVLTGCASQGAWVKPGSTNADLGRDTEACEKEQNAMGGSRGTTTIGLPGFERRCLMAHGWTWSPLPNP